MSWKNKLKLYVITDGRFIDEVKGAMLALEGGATTIQLRMKNSPTRKMIEVGREIRKLTKEYDALFIVNDRVDVALATDADGVHLGQEDMPIDVAREIVGDIIIGISASNLREAMEAEKNGADYIGAGSVFPTTTKEDARYLGLDGLKEVVSKVRIPVVAIGGITLENVNKVLETGVQGIAVISAIMGATDVKKAASLMRKIIDKKI
ncbi:thiamine phosphate synthase [Euryarchaeota archaeon ex4484_178]|nr:MAG: thiamine phosphate synthase [Euryarchaeota archaeon ex4484_178]